MPTRRCCRKHEFELNELLLAGTLALVVMGAALQMTYQTWAAVSMASSESCRVAQLYFIRNAWQELVHDCPASGWQVTSSTFRCGSRSAGVTPGQIVFATDTGRKSIALPEGWTAAIAVDRVSPFPDAAVLTIRWHPLGARSGAQRERYVHVVACSGEKAG